MKQLCYLLMNFQIKMLNMQSILITRIFIIYYLNQNSDMMEKRSWPIRNLRAKFNEHRNFM